MLLVMVLVAMGVILGMSYLSAAALRTDMARTYQTMAQARYLAESGLEHALYVLRYSPQTLNTVSGAPSAEFQLDGNGEGSYRLSAVENPNMPGAYTVTATASVGSFRKNSSMLIRRSKGPTCAVNQAMYVGSGSVWTPYNALINGNVHVNGVLYNTGAINGIVTADGGVVDFSGRIVGLTDSDFQPDLPPSLSYTRYLSYRLGGAQNTALAWSSRNINNSDPIDNGGAVTAANPGGVVNCTSGSKTVSLNDNVNFTGTLVINGNVKLDGANIRLTAVNGFPAIICTGAVIVTRNCRNVVINGVVSTGWGVLAEDNHTGQSNITINGALLAGITGLGSNLNGDITINYNQETNTLYDFTLPPAQCKPQVSIMEWRD